MPYSDKAQVNEDLNQLKSVDPELWYSVRKYVAPKITKTMAIFPYTMPDVRHHNRHMIHGLVQDAILERSDPTVRGEHDTWGCITQVNNGKIWVYVWENWENEHFGYYNDAATGILNCYLQVITRAQSTS